MYLLRIKRHNLNLLTHIKRLAHKTICFSTPEEAHDKVIDWYLTIHHYSYTRHFSSCKFVDYIHSP
ncbi:MAG: IS1 family transposase [Yersinia sp. (in: enterobacteria)]